MSGATSRSSAEYVHAATRRLSQVVFALLAPGDRVANIMQATVASAGASQVRGSRFPLGFDADMKP
eukprot:1195035-Prorocentrum_minimum.AAC.3